MVIERGEKTKLIANAARKQGSPHKDMELPVRTQWGPGVRKTDRL